MEPVFADRKSVLDYAERTFGTLPDYPWLRPLLQIQDELVFELPADKVEEAAGLIRSCETAGAFRSRHRGHPEYKMRPAGAGRSDRLSAVFSGISYE